jgi:hypothetical protein
LTAASHSHPGPFDFGRRQTLDSQTVPEISYIASEACGGADMAVNPHRPVMRVVVQPNYTTDT